MIYVGLTEPVSVQVNQDSNRRLRKVSEINETGELEVRDNEVDNCRCSKVFSDATS